MADRRRRRCPTRASWSPACPGPWAIAGCAFAPPAGNGPCVTALFITCATLVTSNGQPLLLMDSQAICAPTGTPLLPPVTQTRVIGM